MKKFLTIVLIAALTLTLASCSLIGPRYPSAESIARYHASYREDYGHHYGRHSGRPCHGGHCHNGY